MLAAMATVLAASLLALVWETKPAEAAFPGANGKIVFSSNRTSGTGVNNPTGDQELFVMNRDGTGVEQLTFNTAYDSQPTFSEDGGVIAYVSDRDGNYEIYMRTYGRNPELEFRMTNNAVIDQAPAFSPNNVSKIAFSSFRDANSQFPQNSEIYVMDTVDNNPTDGNGDNPTRLTNNTVGDYQTAWSPDGSKIAFDSDTGGGLGPDEIFVMDAADGDPQANLTQNPANDDSPAWSPNGSKIAFTSSGRISGDFFIHIYVMNADGSQRYS